MFTWTGFYIGVNAGARFHGSVTTTTSARFRLRRLRRQRPLRADDSWPCAGGAAVRVNTFGFGNGFDHRNNDGGFAGGGQIGYNYQFTPGSGWVIGIEADIQGDDFGRRRQ